MATAVAERMNATMFQRLQVGSSARLAGKCSQDPLSQQIILKCSDNESVPLDVSPGVDLGAGFVELVGTKVNPNRLQVTGVSRFQSEDVDYDLWNQALQLTQTPQLRHLFRPSEQPGPLAHGGAMGFMP